MRIMMRVKKSLLAFNENDLKIALKSFYLESNQPKLLEINTASHLNDEILLNYFKYIK